MKSHSIHSYIPKIVGTVVGIVFAGALIRGCIFVIDPTRARDDAGRAARAWVQETGLTTPGELVPIECTANLVFPDSCRLQKTLVGRSVR